MDLAVGKALHQQGTKGCGGNSADAVLIKHCQAPSFSRWRRGLQVHNNTFTSFIFQCANIINTSYLYFMSSF